MSWVDQGEASLLGLDAGEVYVAGRYHSLVPILQEVRVQICQQIMLEQKISLKLSFFMI